jgi:hypothetical protein
MGTRNKLGSGGKKQHLPGTPSREGMKVNREDGKEDEDDSMDTPKGIESDEEEVSPLQRQSLHCHF